MADPVFPSQQAGGGGGGGVAKPKDGGTNLLFRLTIPYNCIKMKVTGLRWNVSLPPPRSADTNVKFKRTYLPTTLDLGDSNVCDASIGPAEVKGRDCDRSTALPAAVNGRGRVRSSGRTAVKGREPDSPSPASFPAEPQSGRGDHDDLWTTTTYLFYAEITDIVSAPLVRIGYAFSRVFVFICVCLFRI